MKINLAFRAPAVSAVWLIPMSVNMLLKNSLRNPRTVRIAATMAILAVVATSAILLGLNVIFAQDAGISPGNPITVTLSSPCGPGGPSDEACGSAPATFTNAPPESEVAAIDTRWFRFTAKADWTYTISGFGYTDDGDVAQLSLFEQDGSTLLASDDSTDSTGLPFPDVEIVWKAPAAGNHLVKFFQPLSASKISSLVAQLGIHGKAPFIKPPTEPPTATPTLTPTLTPTPVPIIQCPVSDIDGWFEPVQGVWQDDYTFPDKATRRLTKKTGTVTPLYTAELKMVQGRHTLLFGIRGTPDPLGDSKRLIIQISGKTSGNISVPVHFAFFLNGEKFSEASKGEISLPLDAPEGECGQSKPFQMNLIAAKGIPKDKAFTIDTPAYVLDSELRRDDAPTKDIGIRVTVEGLAVPRMGPRTHFVPVLLRPSSPAEVQAYKGILEKDAAQLAAESALHIPDFYPLPPQGLPTMPQKMQDFSALIGQVDKEWESFLTRLGKDVTIEEDRRNVLLQSLTQQLRIPGILAGAERVVVILSLVDYQK
ncbi:MAG: hypothetical protein CMJ45_03295, partial [Planctomyces sp.]|nr:hypothetical protein [Planctomyces sp.]